MSSSQDFGVEQFFRADEFRAVDPSPHLPNDYNKRMKTISKRQKRWIWDMLIWVNLITLTE